MSPKDRLDRLDRLEPANPGACLGSVTHLEDQAPHGALRPPEVTREESDFLGTEPVPSTAYWGIHTLRAVENFPISGHRVSQWPDLVVALAQVKRAAALANAELQVLAPHKAHAIVRACDDLVAGQLHAQFPVDVIQGGAGTSTNMNANEVIANRALEYLGLPRGHYETIHPNDDVNASQSTNDVYPTALRLAAWWALERLLEALARLRQAFEAKAKSFTGVLKIGRTQLQDAVPMTLGQEFRAFAVTIGEDEERLREAQRLITEINLGGTAIGTGINAPQGFGALATAHLRQATGVPVVQSAYLIEATQDTGAFVQLSGVLKRVACKLGKVCNDLRLLSSGPQAGFGDITLPARQAGSSIMPGKVNPVIPEVMNQVAFEVIGNDVTITMASEAGQLQLNAFEPIIGWSLAKSIAHLTAACQTLTERCVQGIEANHPVLQARVAASATLATALSPLLGYQDACRLAKHALASGTSVAQAAQALGLMDAKQVQELLVPQVLAAESTVA